MTTGSGMNSISALGRVLLLGVIILLPGLARAKVVEFNLPAQPADRALLAFSRQAKVELLFPFDELHKVESAEVTGRHEPEEALRRLLEGTGFTAQPDGHGKFVVTPLPPPTGSIRGRLLAPDGSAARGVRVTIPPVHLAGVTDENGGFNFPAVPPGSYHLVATGAGMQSLQFAETRVEARQVTDLATQTLQAAGETAQLDPFVVRSQSDRPGPFDRGQKSLLPRTAAGNLDLPRSQDDALPFTVYDREQIARSGVVNLNEFLQRELLDSDTSKHPPEQDGNQNAFVVGSTNLNLRGYNADETVVLVNGRRLPEVVTNLSASPDPNKSPAPDVNFVPLSLVERVEVLPASSSALYSGNPVGGVINIVLRTDLNATEVSATYTNALRGFDAPQSTLSLQHGETLLGGALRLRFNASLTRTVPATESELGFIQANLLRHPPGPGTSLYRATPNISSAGGSPLLGPGSASVTSVAPGADGTGGLAAFAGRQGVQSLALFNPPGGFATTPNSSDYPYGRRQRGSSYFASATYDVLPWLQVGLDGIYTRTVANPGNNVFFGDLTLKADSPFNPFQQDLKVSLNEMVPSLGEDYSEARIDFFSSVLGLLVKLPGEWRASVDAQYGRNTTKYRGLNKVDADRWQALVDAGIYNPLRDTQVHAPPQAFQDQALIFYGDRGKFVTLGDYDTVDTAVRVTNQALKLPTGKGAASVGADYQVNHLTSYANIQRYGDGTLAGSSGYWTGRTLQRVSVFGEVQAPLVPVRRLPDWLRGVETDLALRYVAADTSQATNLAPTGGLKLQLASGFTLRGSFATANRFPTPQMSRFVPSPTNTGGGGGEVSTVQITDPLRGSEQYNVLSSAAVNTNLRPEAAVTRTVGLIFQRGEIHRLRAAVDYVDTQKSNELRGLDEQSVIDLEGQLPGRVLRAPLDPGDTHSVGRITSVVIGNFNLAWRRSKNWNTSLDYEWTECRGGRLDVYGRWVYFQRFDVQFLPNSAMVDELRRPDGAASALLRNRLNFGASWSNRDFGFGVDGHYFCPRILPPPEQQSQGSDRIEGFTQYDAYVQRDLARWLPWKDHRYGLRVQLRVNNLLGASPPAYASDPSGAGVQSYGDWRGRVYSLSLTATF